MNRAVMDWAGCSAAAAQGRVPNHSCSTSCAPQPGSCPWGPSPSQLKTQEPVPYLQFAQQGAQEDSGEQGLHRPGQNFWELSIDASDGLFQ